jgi:hypothetical protein
MSLTERVVRAENGGHLISHFFLASMGKDLRPAPHAQIYLEPPQPIHAGMRDRGDSEVAVEITRGC